MGEYLPIDYIKDTGVYKITVNILHSHAFDFGDNVNSFEVVVNKKDISEEINFYNIPANYIGEYEALGFIPGVDLASKYAYVYYEEVLLYNNQVVNMALDIGVYNYLVEIVDDNYYGSKEIMFTIVKKNITSKILFNISDYQTLIEPNIADVRAIINDYSLNLIKEYVYVDNNEVVTVLSKPGKYKLSVKIDDEYYCGEKTIYFVVVKSVEHIIDEMRKIKEEIDALNSISKKIKLYDSIRVILINLSETEKDQIKNNSEYEEYISYLNFEYQTLKQSITNQTQVADKVASISILIPVLFGFAVGAFIHYIKRRVM